MSLGRVVCQNSFWVKCLCILSNRRIPDGLGNPRLIIQIIPIRVKRHLRVRGIPVGVEEPCRAECLTYSRGPLRSHDGGGNRRSFEL